MQGNSSDYSPGFQINKAYEVIDVIGHGGMGTVYRVRHLFLSKEMALKVLPSEHVSEVSWRRFQIEAQAIARLTHPNIVRIFDMGMVDGTTPYYAMELLNGQSLAQKLKKKHALPLPEALAIFRQVCAGLAYAHEHQIIHRDIKPGNIVLQEVEPGVIAAKLVDFGIAKLTTDTDGNQQGLTRPGEVFGSPQYMSPEQCAGLPVDYRTDLYSLGAALFETLTGRVPFRGPDAMATVQLHQTEQPPSLYDASEGIDFPPRMQELISSLLAKDPEDRPVSASDVAAELLVIERSFVEDGELRKPQTATGVRKPVSQRQSEDDEESHTTAKKGSLAVVAISSLIGLTLLGGIGYYFVSQSMRTHTAAEIKKEAKQTEDDEKGRVDLAFKREEEIKNPFFLGTTNKDGHQVSQYLFPQDISIGTLTLRGNDESVDKEAKGAVDIPTRYFLQFTPNNECLMHPAILKRFDDGTLKMITLTTDGDEFVQRVSATGIQSAKEPALDASGKHMDRSEIVNDNTLKNLTQVKSIKSIELSDTAITGESLVMLSRFPKLVELKIGNTSITGEQLAQSGILANLELLHADGMSKISAALHALENSPKLRQLYISFCHATPLDLKSIGTMKRLTKLKISNNEIGDADLEPLTKLPQLERLEVDNCKITPASAKYFNLIPTLKILSVERNGWTPEQFKKFKAEVEEHNPNVKVHDDPAGDPGVATLAVPPAEQ